MDPFSEEDYNYIHSPAVASEEEEEEAWSGHDRIKDSKAPQSRFGATDCDDDGKENGDSNDGGGDRSGK